MKTNCRFLIVLGFFLAFPTFYLFAQVAINADNSPPDNSAMLDVKSTTKGALPTDRRMILQSFSSLQKLQQAVRPLPGAAFNKMVYICAIASWCI